MTNTTKVYFITGISSGLGQALADAVLTAGGKVAGTFRNALDADAFTAKIPGRTLGVVCDITDPAAVEAAVALAANSFSRIDVVANNAGAGTVGAVEETSLGEARDIFNVNLFGQFNVLKAALPHLRRQQSGHILTFSAMGGFTGFPGLGVYSAAKAAADVMSEALAQEVAGFGIKTTILTLGIFRTRFAASSLRFTEGELDAYGETPAGKFRGFIGGLDGKQPNNPAKAAEAILQVVESPEPPLHLPLGGDAVEVMRRKLDQVSHDVEDWAPLAQSTAFETNAA